MSKIVVIYKSKYGSTKKYAEWIAKELGCDIFDRKNIKAENILKYDTIIYGGGLYAGGVSGIDIITKNFENLKEKTIILFTCGIADPKDRINTDHIRNELNKVLTNEMREKIKVFHLRGALNYSKLSFIHSAMMAMMYKVLSKKSEDELRQEDKEMMATYKKNVDFTDKYQIIPILEYVQNI